MTDDELRIASIAYGESSVEDDPDEIRGIAFAIANRMRAWGKPSVESMLQEDKNYSYVVKDGNARYKKFISASEKDRQNDKGMQIAVFAAKDALADHGDDPSNGAFWWDGVDLKLKRSSNPRIKFGFKYGSQSHNIFNMAEISKETTVYWQMRDKRSGRIVNKNIRGSYSAVYESTAAHNKTIFWKYTEEFILTTGAKSYR